MPEPHPPEPGADDPVAAGGGDLPQPDGADLSAADEGTQGMRDGGPVPAIDLSEPEPAQPAPAAPAGPEPEGPDPAALAAAPPLATGDDETGPPLPPPSGGAGQRSVTEEDEVPAGPKGQAWKMVLVVVVFLAVVVVAYLLGKSGGGKENPTATGTSSTTLNTTPVDTKDWTTYTDDVSGFALKHPKDWAVTGEPAGQNRLLISAGQQNFLLVTARNIDPATVADEIAGAMADLDIISGPDDLKLSGQPAILYIYNTPVTPDNDVPGVIIHYFIVRGSKMYSLIFQARPKDELNRLARTYNAVTNSFQSTSDGPAPEPLPTTAETPTTVAGTTSTTR